MVTFKINCPSCKQKVSISVEESNLGTRYKTQCPSCVSTLVLNLPAHTKLKRKTEDREPSKTTIISNSQDTITYQLISDANNYSDEQFFKLNQPYLSFGRLGSSSNSDLQLITRDKSISRKHCIFRKYNNGVTIEDVSLGGTLLNGSKLEPKSEVYLADGDVLRMGQTILKFKIEED